MSWFFPIHEREVAGLQWLYCGILLLLIPVFELPLPAFAVENSGLIISQQPSEAWLKGVQESISRMEYEVTWQEKCHRTDIPGAYHISNREQNLRAYFTTDGVSFLRRCDGSQSKTFLQTLPSTGRGKRLFGCRGAEIETQGNWLEYHSGDLKVRYLNEESGLHQRITLDSCPDGQGPLQVMMTINPGTHGTVSLRSGVVELMDNNTILSHWHRFHAVDNRGLEFPIEVDLEGNTIQLSVEDTGAVYPLVIESVFEGGSDKGLSFLPDWTTFGGQELSLYGMTVCTGGDLSGDGYSDVMVAAPFYDNGQVDEGRVFFFGGAEDGVDTSVGWTAESNQAKALFGFSMSTAGDVNGDGYSDMLIGAIGAHIGDASTGAVFAWYGRDAAPPPGTPENADWVVAEGVSNLLRFGFSVSTAGDVNGDGYSDVIVGESSIPGGESPRRRIEIGMEKLLRGLTGAGALGVLPKDDLDTPERAYVYYGSATGLSSTADWTADSSSMLPTLFGYAVGTAGDVNGDGYSDVIIGAPYYFGAGRAFVWFGSSTGLGEEGAPHNADWKATCSQSGAWFGGSTGTVGDVNGDGYSDVAVGSFLFDNPEENEGMVFVWHGSSSGPEGGMDGTPLTADWKAESNRANAQFGVTVGTAGDVNGDGYGDLLASSWRLSNGQSDEGAVFVWHGSISGLGAVESPNWWAESNMPGAFLGISSGTAGDVNGDGYSDVIVGAFGYTHDYLGEGGASVFYGSSSGLALTAGWADAGDGVGRNFGGSVATAGDVNGDGFADVLVAAPNYEGGGRVFLYAGTAQGLTLEPVDWIARTDVHTAGFGRSVASAGDVNGDGYSDVIVGAYETETNDGEAQVFYGSLTGLPITPNWRAVPNQADAWFGYSVGTAGDVNGDGYSDVIIGSPHYTHGQNQEGAAFVWHGSETGLGEEGTPENADWSKEGNQANAHLGFAVGTAGDVNADGYSEVIFGAPEYTHGHSEEGRAYVYYGSRNGLHTDFFPLDWGGEIDQGEAAFGSSVGTAGDVNGDGYADIVIGARKYNQTYEDEGRVFVYHGSSSRLSNSPDWQYGSGQRDANLGTSVGTAGDVNGDGYADVVVGADQYDDSYSDEGRVYVFHGSRTGLSLAPDWSGDGNLNGALLGYSVSTAGDVNGDGYADLIAGAINYRYTLAGEGAAFLSYGNGGRGAHLRARQRTVEAFGPVSHLGLSDTHSSIHLAARKSSPFGGKQIALECEVKPLGVPFNGTGTVMTGYDVTNASATITHLFPGTPYHWRLRLHYHPAAFPFQQASRWFTVPWNGWQEADFRTRGTGTDLYSRVEHLFMCGREFHDSIGEDMRVEDLLKCLGLFPSLAGEMLSREDFLRRLWE